MGNTALYVKKGVVDFARLMNDDPEDPNNMRFSRIPHLTHVYGFEACRDLMMVLVVRFNNSLNIVRPMTAEQALECAEELIMTTQEDYLSFEDFAVFFQLASQGRYGKIYNSLDKQIIFGMLEEYRQERREALLRLREEKHAATKSIGPVERTNDTNHLAEAASKMMARYAAMKEMLKTEREINRANRL